MKFRKFGRIGLALAVSLGTGLGVTSCSTDHTVGYFYVTGSQYNQISGFRIDNNLGQLTPVPNSPFASGGVNPIKALVANAGKFLYVLNAGCGGTSQIACPTRHARERNGSEHLALHHRRQGCTELPGVLIPARATIRFPSRRTLPAPIYSCSILPSPIPPPASAMCLEIRPPSVVTSLPSTSTPIPAGFR